MSIYRVTRKSDGQEVYRYEADQVLDMDLFPLSTHDHLVYVPPPPDPAPLPARHITKRSFWNRFPANNELAYRGVLITGSPPLLAAGVDRLRARVDASPFVDLDLAEVVGGVSWLASVQVPSVIVIDGVTLPFRLTADQASAVLTAPVLDHEAFHG